VFLIDRFQTVDQLPSPFTVLLAEVTRAYHRRPHNVTYSSKTWREEIPLEEPPVVVIITPQASAAVRHASAYPADR
jgi:hypothetical protein